FCRLRRRMMRSLTKHRTAWRRPRFPLIELPVVMAIIRVRTALLLPAVPPARDAARRSQCKDKMEQVGLALHCHRATRGGFAAVGYAIGVGGYEYHPASFAGPAVIPRQMNISGLLMLMPYLDQGNIYNQWNFQHAASHSFVYGLYSA